MHKISSIHHLNEEELKRLTPIAASWHNAYTSNWIYIGNIAASITNEQLIINFSQFGEIVHIDRTEKQKFGFIKYQQQQSTILAIDNFNNAKMENTLLCVDHAKERTIQGQPLLNLNAYDVSDVDTFRSIMLEYGGNCCPELFEFKAYLDGKLAKNPLKKRNKLKLKPKK